jgi:hypothetical protein
LPWNVWSPEEGGGNQTGVGRQLGRRREALDAVDFQGYHGGEQIAQPGNGAQQLYPMVTAYAVTQPLLGGAHLARQGLEQGEILSEQLLGTGGQLDLGR